MERLTPPRGGTCLKQRLLPFLLLLAVTVRLSSSCDVRNDLRGAGRKTQHAPVVFAGTVRSRGAERHGFYQVTVDVERVVKGRSVGDGPLRLRFRRPQGDAARRTACVAEALVQTGERYIVFVKAVGGPRNFTAVAPPEKHNRRNMRRVTRVMRRRRGRSPPRIAKMKSVRLPAGRRLRLQCRVRGVPLPRVSWYHNGRPVNASRRIRFRTKKKKRRVQSFLIIRRVLPGDAGSYQCRAKNRAGESSKRARVAVFQRRVRPPPTPKPTGPDKPKPPDSWRAAEACDIPSYCLNGGSCTLYRSVMEYVCQCAEGFKGKRCERKTVYAIKQRPDEPPLKAGQFQPLVLVLGGLSVLLLLLLLIAVLWRRRSRPRGRAQCRNGAVAMATGNGTIAMATDEASKPAEAAPTSMRRPPQQPAGRSEQVPAAAPVSRPGDLSPPPSPPSETTKLSSSSSTDLRRAPPAGSDVARDGAVSPPTQKSVKELDVLLQTLDLVTGPDESIPKRLA